MQKEVLSKFGWANILILCIFINILPITVYQMFTENADIPISLMGIIISLLVISDCIRTGCEGVKEFYDPYDLKNRNRK